MRRSAVGCPVSRLATASLKWWATYCATSSSLAVLAPRIALQASGAGVEGARSARAHGTPARCNTAISQCWGTRPLLTGGAGPRLLAQVGQDGQSGAAGLGKEGPCPLEVTPRRRQLHGAQRVGQRARRDGGGGGLERVGGTLDRLDVACLNRLRQRLEALRGVAGEHLEHALDDLLDARFAHGAAELGQVE